MKPFRWFCHPCGDWADEPDMISHFRRFHPDIDSDPERWPDGGLVVLDETVEEDFF